jgi:peroxiredoxin
MRPDIVPGATLPDFELSDETGKRRRLSEIQGNDPLCVVVARGHWCPKDQRQHRWLVDMEPEIDVSYSRLVTISSSDSIFECLEWKKSLGAHWPFLADQRRIVQAELDIAEYTDPHHDPAIPHTFMLEPGLMIYSIYDGYWYWGRPTPDDLRRDFRAITAKARPDWDLARPGLREKWEAGDRSAFWPYKTDQG